MTVASLNASLLTRKGDARPSGVTSTLSRSGSNGKAIAPTTQASEVARLAGRQAAVEAALRRDREGRVRISLRLEPERHRQLRLASVHLEASLQDILTQALDAYLSGLGFDDAGHGEPLDKVSEAG